MTIGGGLRLRLVEDSFREMLQGALEELGWFDPGRAHRPVEWIDAPKSWDEAIAPNALAIETPGVEDYEAELGNWGMRRREITLEVNLWAENESVGEHLSMDVAGICMGRITAAGHERSGFSIMDLSQATPSSIGHCSVIGLSRWRQPEFFERSWEQFWYILTVTVETYWEAASTGATG